MRKRSAYRPKPVISDPLSLMRPASQSQRDALLLRFLTALEEMARGEAPAEDEWRDLSDAVNTVETLALSLGKLDRREVMPLVNLAIAAMVDAARRFKAGQGMRLDAAGLQALRDVVEVYRQCMELLPERVMVVAHQMTVQRVNELLRIRNTHPEVVTL